MGWGTAIGATIGALTAGATAIGEARRRKQQEKLAVESSKSSMFQSQKYMQQLQDMQRQSQIETQNMQHANETRKASLAMPTPLASALAASTLPPSPLGDTSEPTLGRRKLLGG